MNLRIWPFNQLSALRKAEYKIASLNQDNLDLMSQIYRLKHQILSQNISHNHQIISYNKVFSTMSEEYIANTKKLQQTISNQNAEISQLTQQLRHLLISKSKSNE